jgi:hypothetical protein
LFASRAPLTGIKVHISHQGQQEQPSRRLRIRLVPVSAQPPRTPSTLANAFPDEAQIMAASTIRIETCRGRSPAQDSAASGWSDFLESSHTGLIQRKARTTGRCTVISTIS